METTAFTNEVKLELVPSGWSSGKLIGFTVVLKEEVAILGAVRKKGQSIVLLEFCSLQEKWIMVMFGEHSWFTLEFIAYVYSLLSKKLRDETK